MGVGEVETYNGNCSLFSFRHQLPPVEIMPTPYHTLSWLGPPCASRTHKNTFSRLGVDEQPATQVIYKNSLWLFANLCTFGSDIKCNHVFDCICHV